MANVAARRGRIMLALIPIFIATTGTVSGTEWKKTISVGFTEMPWGRFTGISIEYLPDIGDSIEDFAAYSDPEKLAELMAEVQAEADSGRMEEVGRFISISVPGLEYGMTGQWDNVRIESGNGISVPPDQAHIGTATSIGQQTTYTGQLIITEFSEERIRGSYSAKLYNANATRREYEAGRRDLVGQVVGDLDFEFNTIKGPDVQLAEVPDDMSDSDAALLERIRAAGVDPEIEGQMLEMLRGMNPAMQDMVLESQNDSY